MTILVAEDDPASRKILETLLRKKGHEVVTATNGTEAWEIMRQRNSPKLIILDWLMPGFAGVDLCRMARREESEIPAYIIMLTIKGAKHDVIEGLGAGANDYLAKPYDAGELYARVNVGMKMIALETALSDRIVTLKINEAKIETLLAEKDLLLYEVHHRIKNNMNTAINLLTLQADSRPGTDTEGELLNAATRLKSMSVLYDKLYRAENLSSMQIGRYLPSLIDEIVSVFPDRHKVQLDIDIDDFSLDVPRLSSLGIIVNELITNAFKYAFVGLDSGTITVRSFFDGKGATLIVADDGRGLPPGVSLENPQGFGLRLVRGLAEQMGGSIRLVPAKGTKYLIEFAVSG